LTDFLELRTLIISTALLEHQQSFVPRGTKRVFFTTSNGKGIIIYLVFIFAVTPQLIY